MKTSDDSNDIAFIYTSSVINSLAHGHIFSLYWNYIILYGRETVIDYYSIEPAEIIIA